MRFGGMWDAALLAAALVAIGSVRVGEADESPAKTQFVGDGQCLTCHYKPQHASWKTTSMARAMKSLAPTSETDDKALFDKKKAANLDPAKDYSTDEKCLKCHTTGYGEPGGYPVDPAKDKDTAKTASRMGKVSCEACHGPGGRYAKHKSEAMKKDKDAKFKAEELKELGLVKPDAAVCARCHNDQAPTKPAEPFDFEKAKAKVHDHPKPAAPGEPAKPADDGTPAPGTPGK